MIEMVDKELIRKCVLRQGWSIRRASRELGVCRQTVRKCIEDPAPPKYKLTKPRPRPVLDQMRPLIDQWLTENETLPPKQRYTAKRIYDRLVGEYGFKVGESTVREYVRVHRREQPEVFIPLEFDLGNRAQCDWGEAWIKIHGEMVKVYLFCMRLSASRDIFVRAFVHQRQEAFFQGHVEAFEHFEGIPAVVAYDNLKTAVAKVLTGHDRVEQEAFVALRTHYLFDSYFCNPARGNEKGQVENLVGYARRNFLVPVPEVSSVEELNAYLHQKCAENRSRPHPTERTATVGQVWERERPVLQPLPAKPFDARRQVDAKANSLSMVQFDSNRYSVPSACAHQWLQLKASVDRVYVYRGGELVAEHPRTYGKGEEVLCLDHYLDVLLRKPGALPFARPFRQQTLPVAYQQYLEALERQHSRPQKEFIRILQLHREFPRETVDAAIRLALRHGVYHVEGVRNLALQVANPTVRHAPLPAAAYSHLPEAPVATTDLNQYNRLLAVGK